MKPYYIIYHGYFGLVTWQTKRHWDEMFSEGGKNSYWFYTEKAEDSVYFRICGIEVTLIW